METRTIASLWRRLLAGLVDAALLFAIGALLILVLFGPLARLGTAGQFVGYIVFVLYFGLTESHWGASPGKRLFRIRVVARDGANLTLPRAALRAAIFGALFLCNGLCFFFEPSDRTVISWLDNLGVALLLAQLLLIALNFGTRRSLHDYAAGSFVVRGRAAPVPATNHWAPLLATAMFVGALPVLLQAIRPDTAPEPQDAIDEAQSIAAMRILYARPDTVRAHVHVSRDESGADLVIWSWLSAPLQDPDAKAAELADAVRAGVPGLATGKKISVRLIRSVQIGICFYTARNELLPQATQ